MSGYFPGNNRVQGFRRPPINNRFQYRSRNNNHFQFRHDYSPRISPMFVRQAVPLPHGYSPYRFECPPRQTYRPYVSSDHQSNKSYNNRGRRNPQSRSKYRPRNCYDSRSLDDPKDPLNLARVESERKRRAELNLTPLRGDSALNTPAGSVLGDGDSVIGQSSVVSSAGDQQINRRPNVDEVENQPPNSINPSRNKNGVSNRGHHSRYLPRVGKTKRKQLHKKVHGAFKSRYQHVPTYGNYSHYYMRRDPKQRLNLFLDNWFGNGYVCDYGCNSGDFTMNMFEKFDVNIIRLDAIDISHDCILQAKHNQREKVRMLSEIRDYNKIFYQVGNWMNDNEDEPDADGELYDLILAFSVTKWIHIEYGDSGLLKFFRRVSHKLKPGGKFLIEPQPFSTYKKMKGIKHCLEIDIDKIEPLMATVNLLYGECIHRSRKRAGTPFSSRSLYMFTKPYGKTPEYIRSDAYEEHMNKYSSYIGSPSPLYPTPPTYVYVPCSPAHYVPMEAEIEFSDESDNATVNRPDVVGTSDGLRPSGEHVILNNHNENEDLTVIDSGNTSIENQNYSDPNEFVVSSTSGED